MAEQHQGVATCRGCGNHMFMVRLFGDRTFHAVCSTCFAQWSAPDWCREQYFRAPDPVEAVAELDVNSLPPTATPGIP
jgi:hypothetical protein